MTPKGGGGGDNAIYPEPSVAGSPIKWRRQKGRIKPTTVRWCSTKKGLHAPAGFLGLYNSLR